MKAAALYGGLWMLIAALFFLMPDIDLAASRLFYDGSQGFFFADWLPLRMVVGTVPWIVGLLIVLAVIATAWLVILRKPLWRFDRKALIFVTVATVLGPGLIANTVLKDHWGRARPYQIAEFGGARQFTPAPLPTAQCERNCAFVSGHAALGFSLAAFAFLLPLGARRRTAIAAALIFGALVGLGRIAAGRHFLSDVVYAGLIVFATSWLLYQWIVVRDVLGGAAAQRVYRMLGYGSAPLSVARVGLWAAGIALVEIVAIGWLDRPLATYFREAGTVWRPFFEPLGAFGLAMPYLIVFGVAFIVLRWGGNLALFEPWAVRMRAAARMPALLFAAVAGSGILVDLLKVIVGRPRPKLLFSAGAYEFSWIGLSADHWSFPSGHAATAAALATALWCLWPQPVLFYAIGAALVAASRVVMGAHYLSDVVMGGFTGVLVTRALAAALAQGRLPFRLRPRAAADPVLPPP
ncbi:MAG: phosphatase PAP2 family protein [Alphaproteobacteria bacterium]|nr:MAG: phosphatase PAP2 family protein [Alphaproteobacteria bacterium]